MATYDVEDPTGTYRIESEVELTADELNEEVDKLIAIKQGRAQGIPAAPAEALPVPPRGPTAIQPPVDEGYGDIVGRKMGEAWEHGTGLPSNIKNVVTGGDPDGRWASFFKTAAGVASPASAVLSPATAAIEKGALGLGFDKDTSMMLGNVAEIPLSFGMGGAASIGLLGKTGATAVKAIGMGRPAGFVNAIKHDPHLAYAAARTPDAAGSVLERMARDPSVSIEDLAIAANVPGAAEMSVVQKKAAEDTFLAYAKNGKYGMPLPDSPNYTFEKYVELIPHEGKDLGVFGNLGTPATVAQKISPWGAAAAHEMNLRAQAFIAAIRARGERVRKNLVGHSPDILQEAANLRMARKPLNEVIDDPKIHAEVKEVYRFMDDKAKVDSAIFLPRLRAQVWEKFERQVRKEMAPVYKGWGEALDPKAVREEVSKRVNKLYPDDWNIEDHLAALMPGEFRLIDDTGKQWGSYHTKLEAEMAIYETTKNFPEMTPSRLHVDHKIYMDSDLIRHLGVKGRIGKIIKDLGETVGISKEGIEAAARGEFLQGSNKPNFFKKLAEGKGKGPGYTKDLIHTYDIMDRGIERMLQMTDLHERIAPLLKQTRAHGQTSLADMLERTYNRMWGYRSDVSRAFDNSIAARPMLSKIVAPYALERWTDGVKTAIIHTYLTFNLRYQALNGTQIAQTLLPIVDDISDLGRGWQLHRSPAGKELLHKHGIYGPYSKIEGFGHTKIGSKLEAATSFMERQNQEHAFLIMYDKARRLGLDDAAAATYGKIRGQHYTQFLGLASDRPIFFARIDPLGIGTMFQRFPVKQMELLLDVVMDRNFPGAAKWLAVNFLLGGIKGATMGQAGWLTYKTYKDVSEKHGYPVARFLHSGLPGLIGMDMSSSVMLINAPFGESVAEKLGNFFMGAIGSTATSMYGAYFAKSYTEPSAAKRAIDAFINNVPAARQLKSIVQLVEGDYDIKTASGRLKYKADWKDLLLRSFGARAFRDGEDDSFIEAMLYIRGKRDDTLDYAAARIGQARLIGVSLGPNYEQAIWKDINNWNALWPEYRIQHKDVLSRAKIRQEAGMQSLRDRMRERQPKAIRNSPLFQDFTLGGG